jgi:hypothetical protein
MNGPNISWAPWPVLVILRLGSKVNKAFGKLLSLREVWKVKFRVQTILMSAWAPSFIVEAQFMLILFSLLLHVTHHAFYEDYSA